MPPSKSNCPPVGCVLHIGNHLSRTNHHCLVPIPWQHPPNWALCLCCCSIIVHFLILILSFHNPLLHHFSLTHKLFGQLKLYKEIEEELRSVPFLLSNTSFLALLRSWDLFIKDKSSKFSLPFFNIFSTLNNFSQQMLSWPLDIDGCSSPYYPSFV